MHRGGNLRILIAHQHEVVRFGLRKLVEQHPEWEVCGEAASGEEFLDLACTRIPHVAVLNFSLPGLSGVTVINRLREAVPAAEVLLYTAHADAATLSNALAVGVRGCVMKSEGLAHVVTAIETLARHQPYLSPAVADIVLDMATNAPRTPSVDGLTSREMEVIQFVAEGESNKQIARRLGISVKTVESHRIFAMRKTNAKSMAHLIRFAIRNRLVQI
jgi:DNA-binding NarL/FixJ family response regulator